MGTEKRERKKAGRQAALEIQRAAEARRRRINTARNLILFTIAVIVVALILSGTL